MSLIDGEKLAAWIDMQTVGEGDSRSIYVVDLLMGINGGHCDPDQGVEYRVATTQLDGTQTFTEPVDEQAAAYKQFYDQQPLGRIQVRGVTP